MADEADKKERRQRIDQQVNAARDHIVETALIAFIEELDGKVPNRDEFMQHGIIANFSKTPLTIYAKDGIEFHAYFVWRRQHAVALGFHDGQNPLDLSIVRVPNEAWPAALRCYVDQYRNETTGTA
jgi:hypothetical protein